MAYSIERQATTGLWLVTFDGRALGRGELVNEAINLARQRAEEIGTIPPLDNATAERLRIQARAIEQAEQVAAAPADLPRQSTGSTVREDQAANADGADVVSPGGGPQVVTAEGRITPAVTNAASNARVPVANVDDVGTNDPVRKQAQLMSTPAVVAQPGPAAPATGAPLPSQTTGLATNSDDNTVNNTTRQRLETLFGSGTAGGEIKPAPNILDNYASYTYSISLYLMSRKDFQNMLDTKNKNIAGYQLLMQSAGAAAGVAGVVDPNVAADDFAAAALEAEKSRGRNQFFPLDYYIDDVELRSLIQGKGTNLAHNITSLSFKIIEPNGISLLDNLYNAVQQYCNLNREAAAQNYAAQNFLMVVRWYGYDINGNLVKPGKTGQDAPGSDAYAIAEKFIPFQFTSIKFRVANRLTEYECRAVCTQYQVGASRARGSIPYNVELSSQTIRELLVGNGNLSSTAQTASAAAGETARAGQQADIRRIDNAIAANSRFEEELQASNITSGAGQSSLVGDTVVAGTGPTQSLAPQKANAAANPTITSGLVTALNNFQKDLFNKGIVDSPDDYNIIITEDIIASAKVQPPGSLNKQATAFNSKQGTTAADQKLPSKSTPNTNTKTSSAHAGMSIMQFLDLCLRTSTYITDQQTKIIDPNDPNAPPKQQGSATGVTAWYHIDIEAKPKEYDAKRNDYSYSITYRISPYKINDLQSDWFPTAKWQGTHKKYNYWFTGANNSILNLEQDYNYLYYLVINTGNRNNTNYTTNYREYIKRYYQPNSNQPSQGISNSQVNEPSANAADYLYSPADQARIKMKIVGDPAWIQQGELWSGVKGLQMDYRPFLSDGTINYASQEVLFQVQYNKPVDYNLQTGLMDPGQKNFGANRRDGEPGEATQTYTYKAREVVSHFSKGQFTQDLDGVIILFPKINTNDQQIENQSAASQGVNWTNAPDQSQAETNRLLARAQEITDNRPAAVERFRQQQQFLTNQYESEFGVITDPEAALLQGSSQNPTALPSAPPRPPTSGTTDVGVDPEAALLQGAGATSTPPQVIAKDNG